MFCVTDRIQQMNKSQDGTMLLSTDSLDVVTIFLFIFFFYSRSGVPTLFWLTSYFYNATKSK